MAEIVRSTWDGAKTLRNTCDKLPTSIGDRRISEPSTVGMRKKTRQQEAFVPVSGQVTPYEHDHLIPVLDSPEIVRKFAFCGFEHSWRSTGIEQRRFSQSEPSFQSCMDGVRAAGVPMPVAKYGRCPVHGCALFPHKYRSGPKRGQPYLLCPQWKDRMGTSRACWYDRKMTSLELEKLPPFVGA